MIVFETERLNIRHWQNSDFKYFEQYYSDPVLAKYVGGLKTREEAWRLMATYVGHWHLKGFSYLAVEEKESKTFAGCVGLWKSDPWPELELGYWFMPSMHGKGYASEAAKKMKEVAFEQLKVETLVSYIDPTNEPSIKLAQRLGGKHTETIDLLGLGQHQVYRYTPD